jgi:hypothetical protein
MKVYREAYRHSPREFHLRQSYTLMSNGLGRRLRASFRLPAYDLTTLDARRRVLAQKSLARGTMPEEAHDMRTTRHSIRHVVPLVSLGLMLAGLLGSPTPPAAFAAGVEPFAYRNNWRAQSLYGYQNPWGQQDYRGRRDPWRSQDPWGHRYDRPSRGSRYGMPDRYTIHKGRKCELRCERIRGTRNYSCREYRC